MLRIQRRVAVLTVLCWALLPILTPAPLPADQPAWVGSHSRSSSAKRSTTQPNEQEPPATTQPDENREASPTTQSIDTPKPPQTTQPADASTTTPATTPADEEEAAAKHNTPQVEVYIPSVTALSAAARKSKTARLVRALSGMIPRPVHESDEQFDVAALIHLLERIAAWPDTSLALTTYTQDREGRPRWALRTDWPLEDLIGRLEEMLADDAAAKILENLQLRRGEGGAARLELPDMVLAVLSESGDGSLIASTDDLQPPSALFGQTTAKPDGTRTDGPKKKFLLYCRLNLGSGDEEERRNSLFSHLAGVKDVRYAVSLRKSGQWSERWGVIWNPALGGFLKILFQKARHPIECPADAYATAVMHIGGGGGMADAIAGLKPGTIGMRAGGAMGFAAVPGSGFLPFPDLYYQFRARRKDSIIEDIRTFIAEDTQKRRDDDREPAWHEEKIDGRVVFWHDPAADARFGLMPFTYRQVIFFDDSPDESEKKSRLIVAATSTWPEDAVANWKTLRKKTLRMPSSKKTHWQVRIGWRRLYALAQPYLGILAGLSQDATIPPEPDELDDALSDSVINIQVRLSGLRVRHSGPIPIGAVYVPLVAAASLSATADPSSEAARERIACRRLRVLYHHARLFKKDYGRWPATVAELDGYVDFASHPHLLRLRPRDQSFIEDISSFLFSQNRKARTKNRAHVEEEEIDDSLYEIEWSEDEDAWRLMFREGEFSRYQTIYMDAAGEIHRVEKQTLTTNEADGGNADDEKEKALL